MIQKQLKSLHLKIVVLVELRMNFIFETLQLLPYRFPFYEKSKKYTNVRRLTVF